MKPGAKILRIISCFLAVVLCVETWFPPDVSFAFQSRPAVGLDSRLIEKTHIPEFAQVEWVKSVLPQATRGIIYLIQDAHSSLLAQQRIEDTLSHLQNQKILDAVLIEGVADEITSERFAHIPNLLHQARLFDNLQRRGYLHGAAKFALLSPNILSEGLESAELYKKNFNLFREVMRYDPEIKRAVSVLQVEWQRWLKTRVSADDYDFFLSSAASQSSFDYSHYLEQLIAAASSGLGIHWSMRDQIQWPNMIRVQRLLEIQQVILLEDARKAWESLKDVFSGQDKAVVLEIDLRIREEQAEFSAENPTSQLRSFAAELTRNLIQKQMPLSPYRAFFDWLALMTLKSEIDPEGLIREVESLEDLIWDKKFSAREDRLAVKLGRIATLLDQAGRLELSRGGKERFSALINDPDFSELVDRIIPGKKEIIRMFAEQVLSFYETAENREEAFLDKIAAIAERKLTEKSSLPHIAAVIGGYHKNGLLDTLREKGFVVAVMTPKLERMDQDVAYLERMLESQIEVSTLSGVPAAVVPADDLRELVGPDVAGEYERGMEGVLGGFESPQKDPSFVADPARRSFLKGLAVLFSLPVAATAQDAIDALLENAAQAPAESRQLEFESSVFPLENLRVRSSASGMEGYLDGMTRRIGSHLPGMREKWTRVLAETERMRAMTIGLTLGYSESGGFSPGIRVRGVSGDTLDISSGGLSLAMRTIGLLLDEILVNPVRNQADVLALQAADLNYQWKIRQLAGEVAKLLIILKAAEAKREILGRYIRNLTLASGQLARLVEKKAIESEQQQVVNSFLNEAKDARGILEREITQARAGLKLLLGEDFNFESFSSPIPVRRWLDADSGEQAALVAAAEGRVNSVLAVQAGHLTTQTLETEAKVEKRRGLFSFLIPRGKANPERQRQEMGLDGDPISRRPEVARAQAAARLNDVQVQTMVQQLKGLVEVEAVKFFTAQDAHSRWQRQVFEEQNQWKTRGLVASDYDLDRLTLLKRYVQAQIRVIESRAEMSSASAAWTAAGFEGQSAASENWMAPVLFPDFFPKDFALPAQPIQRSEARPMKRGAVSGPGFYSWMEEHPAVVRAGAAVLLGATVFSMGALQAQEVVGSGSIVWQEDGQIHMSPAPGDYSGILDLKIPEVVTADSAGQLNLSAEARLRHERLKSDFEAGLQAYIHLKQSGAKLFDLLPKFEALYQQALELDRSERIASFLGLPQSPDFKIMKQQAGTYGENQPIMDLVSTRIAKVQAHIPLRELLGSSLELEIDGQPGALIAPPRVLEIDAMGDRGNALIELTVMVEKPIDFGRETAYTLRVKRESGALPVSNGEPARIFAANSLGEEIPLGVAAFQRERVPVTSPGFGVLKLDADLAMKPVAEQSALAEIPFERKSLEGFLKEEARALSAAAEAILPQVRSSTVFQSQQLRTIETAAQLDERIASELITQRNLVSPAAGRLELSPELAAGFPAYAGDAAAWVRTSRVLARMPVLNSAARLSVGDAVKVKLADGRELNAKVVSVGAAGTAHLSGRNEVLIELEDAGHLSELDWSRYAERPNFSEPFLFDLLARAYQQPSALTISESGLEFSGMVGAGAALVGGPEAAPGTSLAEMIGLESDPVQAHHHFKMHRDAFSAADFRPLLESMHLSLAHEAAKFLIHDEGEWIQVLRAFEKAQADGDLVRVRALYDAMVSALISDNGKVEDGLTKLGIQARTDPSLRKTADAFVAVLTADRGPNDLAVRRVLESDLWVFSELVNFAFGLKESPDARVQAQAGAIFEWVWRSLADGQIQAIANSAHRDSLLKGRNPESALTWLDKADIIRDFVYRESLRDDRALLRDGMISGETAPSPAVAGLIDSATAESVSIPQADSAAAIPLIPGILDGFPVTFGELDILTDPAEQDRFLRQSAARGDYELLTGILTSGASENIKKTAVSLLKDSERGRLMFARWFAWSADSAGGAQALQNYGIDFFWSMLVEEIQKLDQSEKFSGDETDLPFHPSSAPKRAVVFDALLKLTQSYPQALGSERLDAGIRMLFMLVSDPADLGRIHRGAPPFSVEGRETKSVAAADVKQIAGMELVRRALADAAKQLPVWNRYEKIVGEARLSGTADEIRTLNNILSVSVFSSSPAFDFDFQDGSLIRRQMGAWIQKMITNPEHAQKMEELAWAHFQAGLSGVVENPAKDGRQSGILWTAVTIFKNLVAVSILGIFSLMFFRQYKIRARKIKAMKSGESVQFYDNLEAWKQDFEAEVMKPGFIGENESKRKVVLAIREWGHALSEGQVDYRRILTLVREVFSWPNLSMREQNFRGFRADERRRDRVVIFALASLSLLTLKQLSRESVITPDREDLYRFLKDRSHRLIVFSYILFQLKNLKDNESYNAVEPKIANSAIQRLRHKSYYFQRRLWPWVRKVYALDHASVKIRFSLSELVKSYAEISETIGEPVAPETLGQINSIVQTRYSPREAWGHSPDNASVAIERKLATRIFNVIAALGSIPAIAGQIKLGFVLFPLVGVGASTAIMLPLFFLNAVLLFSAFTYLSHLYANLTNLHDVQAEEFIDHLSRIEDMIARIPRPEKVVAQPEPRASLPAKILREPANSPQLPRPAAPLASGSTGLKQISFQAPPQKPSSENWPQLLSGWSADSSVAAVVVYVSIKNQAEEERLALDFFKKNSFVKNVFILGVDNVRQVSVDDQKKVQQQVLNLTRKNGKVIFMMSNGVQGGQSSYSLMPELLEESSDLESRPARPAAKLSPLVMSDVAQELEKLSQPGFDGILIAHDLPKGASQAQRTAVERNYRDLMELYGIQVPVRFVDVDRVANGNGFPALASMTAEAEFREEVGRRVENPKIVVLEAYGPPYDPARLMAGSTFFSSSGREDASGRPITTGAIALARASIALKNMDQGVYTLRMKTDTLSLHRFAPQLDGEINLAVTLLPAKKAAKLGVPLFKKDERTRLYGFIEKGAKAFRHLYAKKQEVPDDQITDDTLVPVFTGDVVTRFSPERQRVFDRLILNVRDKWNAVLERNPQFEFDEVLDFWVPLIIASNGVDREGALNALRLFVNHRAGVTNSGRPVTQEENVARHAIYTELFTQVFQQASALNFQIHGQTDENAAFRDVRKLKSLVKGLREAAKDKSSRVQSVETGRAVTIGLNGASPQTALKHVQAFMLAVPYRGTQATVYGRIDSFSSGRTDSVDLGIPVERILGKDGAPLFSRDVQFDELPIFPVGEPNKDLNETLMSLLDGKRIRFNAQSPDDLRRIGYVSLKDLAEGYDPEQGGIRAPAFQHPAMIARSELRQPQAILPEVLDSDQPRSDSAVKEGVFDRPEPIRVGRSEQRELVQLVRDGVIVSALVIFRGILPKKILPGAVLLAAQYASASLRVALKAEYVRAISRLADNVPTAEISPHQILFVEGKLFSNRALLENLGDLAEAPFKVELLFTRDEKEQYQGALKLLGGAERGSLKIRLGATIGEMIHTATSAAVLENAERKKSFAFLGTEDNGARRLRATVANLLVIKNPQAIEPVLLLDAMMSPAIFSLNFMPNRIWAFDSALPMLLAARQFALSA